MIEAMLTGEPFEAPVNIPNAGQARTPADAVLESMCVIDADGIRGRDVAALPAALRRDRAPARRHPGADRRGGADRGPTLAAEAFALDPLAGRGDLRETEAMVDELLGRHGGVAAAVRVANGAGREGTRMRIGFIGLGAMGLPMARTPRLRRPRRGRGVAQPWAG